MIRVIQYGLGPIGSAVAREVLQRKNLQLVGAVDIDEKKVGRNIGEVIGADAASGCPAIPVEASLEAALKHTAADLVLHTTSSFFDRFTPQILEILEAGLDVVSSSEELSFPWLKHAAEAEVIHAAALKAGKTALGTGVNPGFLMDTLPIALTGLCLSVDHISVERVINASRRRGPFQAKIGSGLTPDQFTEGMATGRMGHIGLPESTSMIFDTFGRTLGRTTGGIRPVIAKTRTTTDYFDVAPGNVIGLDQDYHAFEGETEFLSLRFIAALDAENEGDHIKIRGVPNLTIDLQGTNGDKATVAILVNAARRVTEAPAGLVTMRDLPVVYCG